MWKISGTFMIEVYWWLPLALYVLFSMYSFFKFREYLNELYGVPVSPESKIAHFAVCSVCATLFPLTWTVIGFIYLETFALIAVHRLLKLFRK